MKNLVKKKIVVLCMNCDLESKNTPMWTLLVDAMMVGQLVPFRTKKSILEPFSFFFSNDEHRDNTSKTIKFRFYLKMVVIFFVLTSLLLSDGQTSRGFWPPLSPSPGGTLTSPPGLGDKGKPYSIFNHQKASAEQSPQNILYRCREEKKRGEIGVPLFFSVLPDF